MFDYIMSIYPWPEQKHWDLINTMKDVELHKQGKLEEKVKWLEMRKKPREKITLKEYVHAEEAGVKVKIKIRKWRKTKMAKNWLVKEAVKVIAEGKDKEDLQDIGKRFPVLAMLIATIGAQAGGSFVEFASYLPDHLTMNKMNTVLKSAGSVDDEDEDEDEEEVEEKVAPAKAKEEKKSGKGKASEDLAKMSKGDLYELLKKKGVKEAKKMTKEEMVAKMSKPAILALFESKPVTNMEEPDEDEAEENDYSGKSPQELFKLCKEREIKAEIKKPSEYYIKLLKKADAAEAKAKEKEAEESWDDEDEEEEKESTKSKAKGKDKKKDKEEEEDWDI